MIVNEIETLFRFFQIAFVAGDLISPRAGDGPPHDVVVIFVGGPVGMLLDEAVVDIADLPFDVRVARAVELIHHRVPELGREPEIGFLQPFFLLAEEFSRRNPIRLVERGESRIGLVGRHRPRVGGPDERTKARGQQRQDRPPAN